VLIVEDVERVSRLWVIVSDVAYVLLIAQRESTTVLTDIFFIAS
jgi:hypothetical protein